MIIYIEQIRQLVEAGRRDDAKRTLYQWIRNKEIGMATFDCCLKHLGVE